MKRFLGIMAISAVSLTLFTGCGNNAEEYVPAPVEDVVVEIEDAIDSIFIDGDYATGIGVYSTNSNSRLLTSEVEGRAQFDSYVATVTVDSQGRIVTAQMDRAQTRVTFDENGQLTTDLNDEVRTKTEIGPDLGMINVSGIGVEWYEQQAYFMDWVVGKTINEIQALEVYQDGRNVIDDADLISHITINTTPHVLSIESAINNAMAFDTDSTIMTGMGISSSVLNSSSTTADSDGVIVLDSVIVAVTLDANDVILAASIDAVDSELAIDSEGNFVTDLNADVFPHSELFNMQGWSQQTDDLTEWMIGRTAAEVLDTDFNSEFEEKTDLNLTLVEIAFEKAINNLI
jgi:hypothetical protein